MPKIPQDIAGPVNVTLAPSDAFGGGAGEAAWGRAATQLGQVAEAIYSADMDQRGLSARVDATTELADLDQRYKDRPDYETIRDDYEKEAAEIISRHRKSLAGRWVGEYDNQMQLVAEKYRLSVGQTHRTKSIAATRGRNQETLTKQTGLFAREDLPSERARIMSEANASIGDAVAAGAYDEEQAQKLREWFEQGALAALAERYINEDPVMALGELKREDGPFHGEMDEKRRQERIHKAEDRIKQEEEDERARLNRIDADNKEALRVARHNTIILFEEQMDSPDGLTLEVFKAHQDFITDADIKYYRKVVAQGGRRDLGEELDTEYYDLLMIEAEGRPASFAKRVLSAEKLGPMFTKLVDLQAKIRARQPTPGLDIQRKITQRMAKIDIPWSLSNPDVEDFRIAIENEMAFEEGRLGRKLTPTEFNDLLDFMSLEVVYQRSLFENDTEAFNWELTRAGRVGFAVEGVPAEEQDRIISALKNLRLRITEENIRDVWGKVKAKREQ